MEWTSDAFVCFLGIVAVYLLRRECQRRWIVNTKRMWLSLLLFLPFVLPVAWFSITYQSDEKMKLGMILVIVICRTVALSFACLALLLCLASSQVAGFLSRISRQWLQCKIGNRID